MVLREEAWKYTPYELMLGWVPQASVLCLIALLFFLLYHFPYLLLLDTVPFEYLFYLYDTGIANPRINIGIVEAFNEPERTTSSAEMDHNFSKYL